MSPTPRQIAEEFATKFTEKIFNNPTTSIPSLIDSYEDAITYALDQIGEEELASEAKRARNDSDGWQEAWLQRGERHRQVVDAMNREIEDLKRRLHDMTEARNNAIEAAHIIHESK